MNISRASLNLYRAGDLPYDPATLCPFLIADLIALYKERDLAEPKIMDQGVVVPVETPITSEQFLRIVNKKEWFGTFNHNHKYDECYIVVMADNKDDASAQMTARFGDQWDKLYPDAESAGVEKQFLSRLT